MGAATAIPAVHGELERPVIRTPSDIHSVAVPMQQSAVKPILSPVSFRYALIQPSITEIKNRGPVAQTFDQRRIHQMLRADYRESISQAVSG